MFVIYVYNLTVFIINFNNLSVVVSIKTHDTHVIINSTTEHYQFISRPYWEAEALSDLVRLCELPVWCTVKD